MEKDSSPSVVLSASAVRRNDAVPSDLISLELSLSPKEKSEESTPDPEMV